MQRYSLWAENRFLSLDLVYLGAARVLPRVGKFLPAEQGVSLVDLASYLQKISKTEGLKVLCSQYLLKIDFVDSDDWLGIDRHFVWSGQHGYRVKLYRRIILSGLDRDNDLQLLNQAELLNWEDQLLKDNWRTRLEFHTGQYK